LEPWRSLNAESALRGVLVNERSHKRQRQSPRDENLSVSKMAGRVYEMKSKSHEHPKGDKTGPAVQAAETPKAVSDESAFRHF
jgi:uncharacterized membrane protein YebE (DUF533 family)